MNKINPLRRLAALAIVGCLAGSVNVVAQEKTAATGTENSEITATLSSNPRVQLRTNLGDLIVELQPEKAPQTVENFLQYVKDGFYSGTIFHRVIDGFMIQGGGYTLAFDKKEVRDPIPNEADNKLDNVKFTIAMARTQDPHSATAQFFINTADNDFLNHKAKNAAGWGYTVFGEVIEGQEVTDWISKTPTGSAGPFRKDVPKNPIIIEEAILLPTE